MSFQKKRSWRGVGGALRYRELPMTLLQVEEKCLHGFWRTEELRSSRVMTIIFNTFHQ